MDKVGLIVNVVVVLKKKMKCVINLRKMLNRGTCFVKFVNYYVSLFF